MVLTLLDQHGERIGEKIDRTLFCWDGASKTDKGRSTKPQAYFDTRTKVRDLLPQVFSTINAWHPDFEADDAVATAVFNSKADSVYTVSGDKDLLQLQGGNVTCFDLNTKAIMTARHICRKFGVKQPAQLAIYLAVVGDAGDGIKGIPGWGPKRAEKLFQAVNESMDFVSALEAVDAQIPDHLKVDFMDSLDKTLLHTDVPGIPDPSELVFCANRGTMAELGLSKVSGNYERVASQYEGEEGNQQALDDMLTVP
jgi:hypothetical protein